MPSEARSLVGLVRKAPSEQHLSRRLLCSPRGCDEVERAAQEGRPFTSLFNATNRLSCSKAAEAAGSGERHASAAG